MKQLMSNWYARWRTTLGRLSWNVGLLAWWREHSLATWDTRQVLRTPGHTFHAVVIVPCAQPCADALRLSSRRILARSAPFLPLPACAFADSCACTYRKFTDRRRGFERRHMAFPKPGQIERRRSAAGRRHVDTN
jgi:hypothetical protein